MASGVIFEGTGGSVISASGAAVSTCGPPSTGAPISAGGIRKNRTAALKDYSTCIVDKAKAFPATVVDLPGCKVVNTGDLQAVRNFMTGDPPASCGSLDTTCAGTEIPGPY